MATQSATAGWADRVQSTLRSNGLLTGLVATATLVFAVGVLGLLSVPALLLGGWLAGGVAGLVGGLLAGYGDPGRAMKLGATAGGVGNLVGGVLVSVGHGVAFAAFAAGGPQRVDALGGATVSVTGSGLVGFVPFALVGLVTGTVCAVVGGLLGGAVGRALAD
jgi:hypothetical protein